MPQPATGKTQVELKLPEFANNPKTTYPEKIDSELLSQALYRSLDKAVETLLRDQRPGVPRKRKLLTLHNPAYAALERAKEKLKGTGISIEAAVLVAVTEYLRRRKS